MVPPAKPPRAPATTSSRLTWPFVTRSAMAELPPPLTAPAAPPASRWLQEPIHAGSSSTPNRAAGRVRLGASALPAGPTPGPSPRSDRCGDRAHLGPVHYFLPVDGRLVVELADPLTLDRKV